MLFLIPKNFSRAHARTHTQTFQHAPLNVLNGQDHRQLSGLSRFGGAFIFNYVFTRLVLFCAVPIDAATVVADIVLLLPHATRMK